MKQASPSVSDEVLCQVMGRQQGLVLRLEDNARYLTTWSVIDRNLFDGNPLVEEDQAHRVVAPIENKSLLDMPSDFALTHLFRLLCSGRPILQTPLPRSKSRPATLADVTPPRDLRTQLPKEADHA